jgi:hypothetical protein
MLRRAGSLAIRWRGVRPSRHVPKPGARAGRHRQSVAPVDLERLLGAAECGQESDRPEALGAEHVSRIPDVDKASAAADLNPTIACQSVGKPDVRDSSRPAQRHLAYVEDVHIVVRGVEHPQLPLVRSERDPLTRRREAKGRRVAIVSRSRAHKDA